MKIVLAVVGWAMFQIGLSLDNLSVFAIFQKENNSTKENVEEKYWDLYINSKLFLNKLEICVFHLKHFYLQFVFGFFWFRIVIEIFRAFNSLERAFNSVENC